MKPLMIKIQERDNVAVAVQDLPTGTELLPGLVTRDPIPQAHKIALTDIPAGVLKVAAERIRKELLPKYPNVDGVVAVTHPCGCGVAINAPLAPIPIRAITNVIRHPNFGGEIMVVGLGCEKLTYDRVLPPEDITPENVLTLQDWAGHDAMMNAILEMAEKKLKKLNERRRHAGARRRDRDVQRGHGGARRRADARGQMSRRFHARPAGAGNEMVRRLSGCRRGRPRCHANPTPGNKKGGLANIVEKAMGSIAKSGTSPIVEVLSPAEKPTRHGLIYAATPASDIVCGPCQVASGIGLQVFMTGRGTPYGLDISPVIKVCSRNELKAHWFDLIDIFAGAVATGEATIAEVGTEIFNMILDVASGVREPYSDQYGFHNDMCIFNPAPIT